MIFFATAVRDFDYCILYFVFSLLLPDWNEIFYCLLCNVFSLLLSRLARDLLMYSILFIFFAMPYAAV